MVEYDGYRYYRDERGYYYNSHTREYLHRAVYRNEVGEIPEGHYIHHKDGDPTNNHPSNLEAVTPTEHHERHPDMGGGEFSDAAREAAAEWHAGEEGREWHHKHGKEVWEDRESDEVECEQCGDSFETPFPTRAKYCSNACKAAARRAAGADDETRTCEYCGDEFTTNKYSDTRYCGKSCSKKAYWAARDND